MVALRDEMENSDQQAKTARTVIAVIAAAALAGDAVLLAWVFFIKDKSGLMKILPKKLVKVSAEQVSAPEVGSEPIQEVSEEPIQEVSEEPTPDDDQEQK